MRCSLVVLNYNEREVLLRCVASLIAAAGPADEVIVVDNGSSDESADAVEAAFPMVKVVRLLENRYIFGLNDGIRLATGDYVALCNNDMVVEPEFVENALACFVGDDVFAVCPRILDGSGAEQGSRTAALWRHGLLFYEPLPHVDAVTDCFFAVGGQSFFRRDLLDSLGSIDPLLWPMYHEDVELSYRAWRAGHRVVYAPEALCHHLGGHTSRKVFTSRDLRSFVRQNELLIVWKDVSNPWMLAQHVAWLGPHVLAAIVHRDTATLLGFARAIRRLPRALQARKAVQPYFRRTDRAVLKRLARQLMETTDPATGSTPVS